MIIPYYYLYTLRRALGDGYKNREKADRDPLKRDPP